MNDINLFKNRDLLIATKHHKDHVIAPLLEKELGVKCYVDSSFDTDIFGTFTGEVERKDDALTTVKNKCQTAARATNCELVVASEGSFFPHPALTFLYVNTELLCFTDYKNNLEIIVQEQSTSTNFGGNQIYTLDELLEFCEKVCFPSHGVILRRSRNEFIEIVKGVLSYGQLRNYYNYFMDTYGEVYVETDMRAMFNPTRMSTIKKATENLITKIKSSCPECGAPGFGEISTMMGLPCEICSFPTKGVLTLICTCQKCTFSTKMDYPNGKQMEDAMYCDLCNP